MWKCSLPPVRDAYGAFRRVVNALAVCAGLIWTPATAVAEQTIIAFGDSLTAGYGLPQPDSFPAQLERYLEAAGHPVKIVNAGVSGDTTAGGRARLAWTLAEPADLVIVELGANDGLRGIDPAETRRNLDAILTELGQREIKVLLAGMLAPPNLGGDYGADFNGLFPELAEKHDVMLYPFFLDGVAARPDLNQADGIHPNAAGVEIIVNGIGPYVIELLTAIKQARSS